MCPFAAGVIAEKYGVSLFTAAGVAAAGVGALALPQPPGGISHAFVGGSAGAVHALFAGGRGLDHPPAVEPHPPAVLAAALLRPGVAPPHDAAALRPGVAPPHPVPGAAPALAPVVYGFGVRELTFHAGVRPPSAAAYGFGVRDDAFHAGVRESA